MQTPTGLTGEQSTLSRLVTNTQRTLTGSPDGAYVHAAGGHAHSNYWKQTLKLSTQKKNPWADWPVRRCPLCIKAGAAPVGVKIEPVNWGACENKQCVVPPPDPEIPF